MCEMETSGVREGNRIKDEIILGNTTLQRKQERLGLKESKKLWGVGGSVG